MKIDHLKDRRGDGRKTNCHNMKTAFFVRRLNFELVPFHAVLLLPMWSLCTKIM